MVKAGLGCGTDQTIGQLCPCGRANTETDQQPKDQRGEGGLSRADGRQGWCCLRRDVACIHNQQCQIRVIQHGALKYGLVGFTQRHAGGTLRGDVLVLERFPPCVVLPGGEALCAEFYAPCGAPAPPPSADTPRPPTPPDPG